MKKLLAMALTLMLLALPCASATAEEAAEKFYVGMECDYAPFNWTQVEPSDTAVPLESGGYADGYDVQIARLVAEGLGRELVIVKTEWAGLPMAVISGRIDAIIAGMSPTADRQLTIDFSDSYYESDLVIVVRADSDWAKARALADFAGARITGQLSTFHYEVIDQIPDVGKQVAMDTFAAMTVALLSGAIDGYVSERPGALSAMQANPELTYVAFEDEAGFVASKEDVAIAVGLAKGSDLVAPINEILAGIDEEARTQMMLEALENQPLNN